MSMYVHREASNLNEANDVLNKINSYPLIIRPAFTLGGVGGGIAYNLENLSNCLKQDWRKVLAVKY